MNTSDHIFITGGTGFLGSYILRHLIAKGYQRISAIKRKTSRTGLVADIYDKINWIEADLFDYHKLVESLQEVDVVIHSAAVISFIKSDLKDMMKVNVEGTAHLVNACLKAGVKKYLQVSSIAAFGRTKENPIITEESEFQNTALDTGYGRSKYLAEQEVWRAGSEGLNVTIINPAMIMGAGYWDTGTAKLIDTVYQRLNYYPLGQSGFVDVRDVARMSVSMLENDVMQTRMVCVGENMLIQDMIGLICRALDKKPPQIKLTPLLRAVAWRAEWLRARLTGTKQLITKETLGTSAQIFTFDNSKSRELLNFDYTPLTLTIDQTCQAYKDTHDSEGGFGILPPLD